MAKFDRKVERNKKEYQFTQKTVEGKESSVFKDNFTLRWIRLNLQTILIFVLTFIVVTLIIIPMLNQYMDITQAFVVGHAVFTSFFIVVTVYLVNREKPQWPAVLVRYLFLAMLLGISAYLSMVLTAWLG